MRFVGDGRKRYTGEVVLGVETDTLDADGAVVATHDMAGVTLDDARRVVAAHLVGDIEQVPPMVSAIRVDGRRLHELAREGIEVERAPRPVTVERFDVARHRRSGGAGDRRDVLAAAPTSARSPPTSATCSAAAPTCATCAAPPSGRSRSTRPRRPTSASCCRRSPRVRGMPIVDVDDATAALVANGRVPAGAGCRARAVGAWSTGGDALLAVYEPFRGGEAKPAVVLA